MAVEEDQLHSALIGIDGSHVPTYYKSVDCQNNKRLFWMCKIGVHITTHTTRLKLILLGTFHFKIIYRAVQK